LTLWASPVSLAQSSLPQLGDGQEMSVAAERKLGQRIARDIYRDPDYIDDAVIGDYVQRIWQPLLAAAKARGDLTPELSERFAWQVMLARDRSVNAFALPGGYMGLHLGLIAIVGNRDELASVMAHELSHVTQRHIARSTSMQNQQTPWVFAAMILGVLAARKNVDVANAVVTGAQAASIQGQLNFSRDMEREADRIGYQVLEGAQFNVQGFVGMFDKLALANRINDNGSFPYLRTHPLTSERIGDMQSRVQQAPSKPAAVNEAAALEHAMIATRARLLADPSVDNLRSELGHAQTQLRSMATNAPAGKPRSMLLPAQLYGGALAALKQRDLPLAQRLADAARSAIVSAGLTESYALQTVDIMLADIAMAQGNAARARDALRDYVQKSPVQRAVLLPWAQAVSASDANAQDRQAAIDSLQVWLTQQPQDAPAWEALATVYTAQKQPLRAIRAQAEARVALLDYTGALDRFKAGQALARSSASTDHIELSIIDSRARAVSALQREFASDKALN
jgi:predicted Zn-dependent protease